MAAWRHWAIWTGDTYDRYRAYVIEQAPKLRGGTMDCADMSLSLLIRFAAESGLPVTLRSERAVRFISKATRQFPYSHLSPYQQYKWGNRDQFMTAVINRMTAKGVFWANTAVNPRGPEPGDLMCKPDHIALVFKTYPPGLAHPHANDQNISEAHGNLTGRLGGSAPGGGAGRPGGDDLSSGSDGTIIAPGGNVSWVAGADYSRGPTPMVQPGGRLRRRWARSSTSGLCARHQADFEHPIAYPLRVPTSSAPLPPGTRPRADPPPPRDLREIRPPPQQPPTVAG
jgi:hypothetical protein